MGFTIISDVNIDNGLSVSNSYMTIKGIYRLERKVLTEYKNGSILDNGYEYQIISSGNLYLNKQSYLNKKSPVMINFNVLIKVQNNNFENLHTQIYSALKEKVKSIFNNQNLEINDDI